MVEPACGAECLVFAQVADGDLRVYSPALFDKVSEHALVIVADYEDFADLGDLCYGGETVGDDFVAGNGEERLQRLTMVTKRFTFELTLGRS